ncbi:MAG: hypothetical protein GYB21_07390, partial [Oceanospirillales bacterium]|nr:hypothetical protein [Oceanospirillales bacterium]
MWWINRLYLDGVGHEESFYKHMTLDLNVTPEGGAPNKHINHTYLQLVNGGGKTTLISFFLTLFEPRKDQFVQVVSGRLRGNKYHYNDYFHPELSTLLMELINQKGQRLLLGQFHQKINDDTEVVSFVCDEPPNLFDLPFERVPSRSRAETLTEMKPFVGNLKLAREWLKEQSNRQDGSGHHWRETHTQAEWNSSLKELGINIDMIKTMVTLNSEEGGIKKFASYQSERDFLSSFYGCVIARNNLDSLINACQQEVKRGTEIKIHRNDEAFYEQLLSKWNRFVQPAEAHLKIRRSMSSMEEKFKEALRDLRHHVELLSHSETQSKEEARVKAEEIDQLNNNVQSLKLLTAELGYQAASMKCGQAQVTLDSIDEEAQQHKETIQALESAEAYRQWVGAKADVDQLDHMCRLYREKNEKPLQEAFDRIAAQSLLIHQRALNNLDQDVATLEADLKETESAYKATQKHINETSAEIGSLTTERRNLSTQEKKGLDALEALKGRGLIEPSESPENAPIRWQKVVENDALQHKRAKNARSQSETELAACELWLQQSHTDVERAGDQKQMAIRERDAAVEEYTRLSQHWSGLPDAVHERTSYDPLEWNAHRVEDQLADWLTPMQADVQAIMQRISAQQIAYNELKAAGHQLLSSSVNLALSKLHDTGVPVDKAWAFPKYLAQVFQDDPAKIANKVDTDPGRYMGIVVLDEATLVLVKEVLVQIEWKDRPIPIFLAIDDDISEIPSSPVPDCVISPQDKLLYSEKATQDKLVELESEIDSLTGTLEVSQMIISELQAFLAIWRQYYRTYGESWSARHQRVHDAERMQTQCIEAARKAEEARDAQKALHVQSLKHEDKAEQVLSTSSEQLKAVESFLSREWQEYRSAQQTLPSVKEAITSHERKKQQLEEKGEQLAEKKNNLLEKRSRLGVKHDTWSSRIEGTLYNQVAPAPEIEFAVSPDDAHRKTEKAADSLEQARSNEDIQSLVQKLEQARLKQDEYHRALDKTAGWHHQQKRVMSLADSAPEELARQHREGQSQLEKTQQRRQTAAVRLEHSKELLLTASNNRPEAPPALADDIMGSIEALEKEQQAIGQRLRSTQQSLAVAKDSL